MHHDGVRPRLVTADHVPQGTQRWRAQRVLFSTRTQRPQQKEAHGGEGGVVTSARLQKSKTKSGTWASPTIQLLLPYILPGNVVNRAFLPLNRACVPSLWCCYPNERLLPGYITTLLDARC